jgi:hypothetical protein
VKHYEQKWSGWECNPFEKDFHFLLSALETVSRSSTDEHERHSLNDDITVLIDGTVKAKPVEFTADGISLVCSKYLSKRDTVELSFEVNRRMVKDWHVELMNSRVRATVMWGIQKAHESQHGLKFVDLTAAEKSQIVSYLKNFKRGNDTHEQDLNLLGSKKVV